MKKEKISHVLENLDIAYIEEATIFPGSEAKTWRTPFLKWLPVAACLALLLSGCIWYILREPSHEDPNDWEIIMQYSDPSAGKDPHQSENSSEGFPSSPYYPGTTDASTVPTSSDITDSPDPPDPIGSTDPTFNTESTNNTESTAPSNPTSSTAPSIDPDDFPAPGISADPVYLDFVTKDPICLADVPSLPAAGGDFHLQQFAFPEILSLKASERKNYPIYANSYPVGQAGALFEITEEYTEMSQENLRTFLTLLFGDGDYSGVYTDYSSHSLIYEDKEISLAARATSLSVTSTAYETYSQLTQEDLNANPLIHAAISYCAIEDPMITQEIEYDVYGNVYNYNYIITEKTADPQQALFDHTFSYVMLHSFVGENIFVLSAVHVEQPEEVGATTLATVEEIEAYLQKSYPHLAEKAHVIELFYSAQVIPGYYVPCYRVFFEEPELTQQYGVPAYSIMDLTDSRFLS